MIRSISRAEGLGTISASGVPVPRVVRQGH